MRLHYLDFGGEGLPIVFVHSEAWDAYTYEDFGPRFSDRNRVLAVTRRGYGQSEGRGSGYDVPSQGESLIDFLDALAIERAVFAGNASATAELTYVAEHHPGRVAGLIYFTGLAIPWLEEHESDPTRAFEMFRRANPGDVVAPDRVRARSGYRPEFLSGDGPTVAVPALAFVARSGTMGNEHGIGALALVGSPLMTDVLSRMPPSPVREYLERLAADESFRRQELEQIPDSVARAYFLRLVADEALQAEVQRYHEETILPAVSSGQERFRRAFGDDLRLVRLDVSQVVGYEYRDAPYLIYPHIREFLDEIGALERSRAGAAAARDGVTHDPTRAVEAALRGYLDAFTAQDRDLLRARITDDFVVIENGYPIRFDRFTEVWDPRRPSTLSYRLHDLEIEVAGEIAQYRFDLGWYEQEERVFWGIETGHARLVDGEWRLARNHMTNLPVRGEAEPTNLRDYVGDYRGLDYERSEDVLRLYLQEDRLFMMRPSGMALYASIGRLELLPDPGGDFFIEVANGLIRFERDDAGEVRALVYTPSPENHPRYRRPLRYERVR